MFQSNRHLQQALALITSELTDLRAQVREDKEAWALERKQLLDRIMVLTKPGALREMSPRPLSPNVLEPKNGATTRPNYPGWHPDTRPASPTEGQLTDQQKVALGAALQTTGAEKV